jgi:hypothetical protein
MVRAVDAKKVKTLSDISSAFKRKIPNVSLNLDTAGFDVSDAAGKVVKTVNVAKGYDAAYVITRSTKEEDVESSGQWLAMQRKAAAAEAEKHETLFAELQDDMLRAVEAWKSTPPGAARNAQTLEIGRLQRNLATEERQLREAQYHYRSALPTPVLRRTYVPLSFDDRVAPYPVYALKQQLNLAKDRVVPIE